MTWQSAVEKLSASVIAWNSRKGMNCIDVSVSKRMTKHEGVRKLD